MCHGRVVRLLVASVLLMVCVDFGAAQAQSSSANKTVGVEMRNVMYHFTDSVAVHIRALKGQLTPIKGDLPIFDDKQSFTLEIASAEIAMTPDNLANVLNSYVFAKHDAPLKDISVRIEGSALKIKGKLHSKGDVGFETEGHLSST